jgi:PBP1b-binding outer membrane lipoprotein LpoB
MDKLDIPTFILFKTDINTQELNNEILKKLSTMFPDIEKKNKSKNKNKVTMLKNQKMQIQKDNISNKVNLILNKLSEKNIDNLVIDFK